MQRGVNTRVLTCTCVHNHNKGREGITRGEGALGVTIPESLAATIRENIGRTSGHNPAELAAAIRAKDVCAVGEKSAPDERHVALVANEAIRVPVTLLE